MDSNAASDEIKSLAINGLLADVETKFGKKKAGKAISYVEAKLQALKEKQKAGQALDHVLYATPFMLFALTKNEHEISKIADEFQRKKKEDESVSNTNKEESCSSQLSSTSSEGTQKQENTPSASSDIEDSVHDEASKLPARAVVTPVREPSDLSVPSVPKAKGFRPPTAHIASPSAATPKKDQKTKEKKERKSKGGDKEKNGKKEKKEKPTKKEKAAKDPDAPKGAKSSFIFFSAHMRPLILKETPGLSIGDVAKEVGVRWKALSEADKQIFVDQAAADKTRYQAEMAEYEAKGGCKRKLSDDIDGTSSTAAAPPRKKTMRTKQVAKASRESEDEGGSDQEDDADADAAEEEIDQEDARGEDEDGNDKPAAPSVVRRAAATAAKKNISAAAKLSTSAYVEREDVKEQDSKDEKKKRARKSSTIVDTTPASSNHGIKQDDLKDDEDLLHTEFYPRATCPYPPPLIFTKGTQLMLVLEPYRAFLADLPADAVDTSTRQEIERICSLPQAVVACSIVQERILPARTLTDEEGNVTAHCNYSLLSVATAGKKEYKILHADFASPLLTCDTFLVPKTKFEDSLAASWLMVNAQVRRMFAVDGDPDLAEWQEGSVYHIRSDMASDPYGAVHVVWMQQEKGSDQWLYQYEQTDSLCSPWDLELSPYVLEKNIKPPGVPRALLMGPLQHSSIIAYLKTFDAASQFLQDMSQCTDPEYAAMFPTVEERMDLLAISRLCRKGRYSDDEGDNNSSNCSNSKNTSGVGISVLFEDLQRMVAQSKAFNAANPHHLPWRLADMMGKAIYRLKVTLAEKRGLRTLQSAVQQDREEDQQMRSETAAMEV